MAGLRFLPRCLPPPDEPGVEPLPCACEMMIFGASFCFDDGVLPDPDLSPPGLFTFGMMLVSFIFLSGRGQAPTLPYYGRVSQIGVQGTGGACPALVTSCLHVIGYVTEKRFNAKLFLQERAQR